MLSSGLIWGGGSALRWWTWWREWEIKMEQEEGRFLNRVETLGNLSNTVIFFHETSHSSTSRANCDVTHCICYCIADQCVWYLFHSSSMLLDNHEKVKLALGVHKAVSRPWGLLLLPLPLLQWIHAGPTPWTAAIGKFSWRQKEQQIANPRGDPRSDALLKSSPSCRRISYLPDFPHALLPTPCSVQYHRSHERSGKLSQIMRKQGIWSEPERRRGPLIYYGLLGR